MLVRSLFNAFGDFIVDVACSIAYNNADRYLVIVENKEMCIRDRTYRFSSAMPLRVLLPRFVKETNAAPRLLATVAAAMIRLVSPEMDRARTRSSEVSCRALDIHQGAVIVTEGGLADGLQPLCKFGAGHPAAAYGIQLNAAAAVDQLYDTLYGLLRNHLDGFVAVSYTHLDVYKRQIKERAKLSKNWPEIK